MNRHTVCPDCGKQLTVGYALWNHRKTHRCEAPQQNHMSAALSSSEGEDGGTAADNYDSYSSSDSHSSSDNAQAPLRTSCPLTKYLMKPEHCPSTEYLSWKTEDLTDRNKKILEFVALVDGGNGMSSAAASRILTYVRRQGGDARALPKSLSTCWMHVEQVFIKLKLQFIIIM